MLLGIAKSDVPPSPPLTTARRRTQSVVAALLRQEAAMNAVKRERWTEEDIDALPAGEHDYFERKSGRLFNDQGDLLGKLAKTVSALANSGGGHILLGVDDDGTPDGVPPTQGRAATRDWLEQKIPHLVEYPLADFRVHVVEPATLSRIPQGRRVIVIDIGDSALAPHQCAHGGGGAQKHTYYYRQAGRSEPAPHFYLELLRQRLVNPALEAEPIRLAVERVLRTEGAIFVGLQLRFRVRNVGRVAAYKWGLFLAVIGDYPEERLPDYRSRGEDYPPGYGGVRTNMRVDATILPGSALEEDIRWGANLRPSVHTASEIRGEIDRMVLAVTLGYRVATETSPGEVQRIGMRHIAGASDLTDYILQLC